MRRPLRAVPLLLALLPMLVAAPALAHSSDPRITPVLDRVSPPLPAQVVVQARAGIAGQLVADNPTATPLVVLGDSGEPFLRLTAAGVEANVHSVDFFATSSPAGILAVPPEARPGAAPAWARISSGSSWGWYDHRLHPAAVAAPADTRREAVLAAWTVPMRYGDQAVAVTGHLVFRPLLGSVQVTVDAGALAAAGVEVQVLQGALPGLFLSDPQRVPVTVLGRDGEPFLRMGADGLQVNTASRTYVEDAGARGRAAGAPGGPPRWAPVAGTTYTWLDARLQYPAAEPPAAVVRAREPVVVQHWSVPVEVSGASALLTGDIRWVPAASLAAAGGTAPDPGARGVPLLPVAAGVLLVLGAAVIVVRRAGRRHTG